MPLAPQLPTTSGPADGASQDPQPIAFSLDNIPLDLPVAGVGTRVLASFIDHLLLALVLLGAGLLGGAAAAVLRLRGAWFAVAVIAVMFFVQWGVWAVVEIATAGRTPGKAALRLRVVTRNGGRPSATAFLIRNLMRLVDYIVGVPIMAFDPMARRVGDHLAGTLVVHDRQTASAPIARRLPRGWGAREAAFVESFVARCGEMEPDRAVTLARRLLAAADRAEAGFSGDGFGSQEPVAAVRRTFAVEGG